MQLQQILMNPLYDPLVEFLWQPPLLCQGRASSKSNCAAWLAATCRRSLRSREYGRNLTVRVATAGESVGRSTRLPRVEASTPPEGY